MTHPLINYIHQSRHQGKSNEEIIRELTQAGWQVHDVLNIVLEHTPADLGPPEFLPTQDSGERIISVSNLSKSYGEIKALDNVSLYVKRGSVTALLGPNGAGKTTLIRILTTLLAPDVGQATVAGLDAVADAQKLRAVIGLTGQFAAVDEILTGRENLEMVSKLYHLKTQEAKTRTSELLHQFDLEDTADRIVKTYSGGMRRRLDLAASLVIRPKVLFLDEPTTGLDPRTRFVVWDSIRELVASGTTVLLTTQYLEEADQLAHYIFVIDHGRIIAQGTADALKQQTGGDVLELHMAHHQEAARAATIIQPFGTELPHVNSDNGIITMPVSGGAAILVDVVRQLDEAGLKLADIILRRPSLDDVFMKLTGHEAH